MARGAAKRAPSPLSTLLTGTLLLRSGVHGIVGSFQRARRVPGDVVVDFLDKYRYVHHVRRVSSAAVFWILSFVPRDHAVYTPY